MDRQSAATCVQEDGLEVDDGGLVVLPVLAVRRKLCISWINTEKKLSTGSERCLTTWQSVRGMLLTDVKLLSSKVEHEALLLLVVAESRTTDAIGFSLSRHIPVLVPAHQD